MAPCIDAENLLSLEGIGWRFIAKRPILLYYLPSVLVVDEGPASPTGVALEVLRES